MIEGALWALTVAVAALAIHVFPDKPAQWGTVCNIALGVALFCLLLRVVMRHFPGPKD